MAYSFYGKNSRTFIKKESTARKFLNLIRKQGGISIKEAKSIGNWHTSEGSIWSLYRRNYIKRFDFQTIEGFIYFLNEKDGLKYGLRKGLIPKSIKILYQKIKHNGAVSSLELRDIGLSKQEINWFYQKLVRSRMLKSEIGRAHV